MLPDGLWVMVPSSLDVLYPAGTCWLVDPLDGSNFVNGNTGYGMMIALVENGWAVAVNH